MVGNDEERAEDDGWGRRRWPIRSAMTVEISDKIPHGIPNLKAHE